MENVLAPGEIILRTVLAYVSLMLATKTLGKQTIAQMNFFEFAAAISIGAIAASFSYNLLMNKWNMLLSLAVFTAISLGVTRLSLFSRRWRGKLAGQPTVIIEDGRILESNMKKLYYSVDYLKEQLRTRGFFDIGQIQTAILETNGDLSVLPKPEHRPLTRGDFALPSPVERYPVELVVEGDVQEHSLKRHGISREWLERELRKKGFSSAAEVFYAVINSRGRLFVDGYRDGLRRKSGRQCPC